MQDDSKLIQADRANVIPGKKAPTSANSDCGTKTTNTFNP